MTEELESMSDEQLRSLADRTQKELARRGDLLRRAIRAEFDARLKEAELTIVDIYPELAQASPPEKQRRPRMLARALFTFR